MMRPSKVGWFIVGGFLIGGVIFTVWIPEIWIGQIWIAVSLALAGYYLVMNKRADRAEKLTRDGIAGEARILEMTQTGAYVNGQPRVRLKLHIQAPGVPEIEAEDTYTVPLIALGALTSGGVLPVYLDRARPSRFTIDWFGGGGVGSLAPALLSASGGPRIDLSANPEARAAVLDALAKYGIDVAHGAHPAAANTSVEPPVTPLDRLEKLTALRDAGLITDKEFEQQKARILDAI